MALITDENNNLVEIPSSRTKKDEIINKNILINIGDFLIKIGNKIKGN